MMALSRRTLLASMAAVVARPAAAQQPRPREEEPLILRAHRKGLIYGAAVSSEELANPLVADIIADECGLVTPPGDVGWSTLQPQPGRFDFTRLDRLINFSQRRNLLMRMRPLVQHQAMPEWMAEAVTPATAGRTLAEHVGPVVARYRGRVHSWDVVGEATEPAHGRTDGLRASPWLKAMGPRYIDAAFRLAHAIDRDALLAYSDSGLEAATPEHESRRRAVLGLLEWLKTRGAPVDALAIQSRLAGPFAAAVWRAFLDEVAGLGVRIVLTDLSLAEPEEPVRAGERVGQYLETTLAQHATIAVLSSSLSSYASRGRDPRGYPLDNDLNRTPVWTALARALDGAPTR
jgi:endo-1,4-beta-xylanase